MAYVPMEHMTNGDLFEDTHVNQIIDNIAANHESLQIIHDLEQVIATLRSELSDCKDRISVLKQSSFK